MPVSQLILSPLLKPKRSPQRWKAAPTQIWYCAHLRKMRASRRSRTTAKASTVHFRKARSTAFWLLVPYLLLHRKIGLRQLLPGALLASLVLGGTAAFSPLFLAAPLNQNGKTFGSFGVVLTLLGYVFVLITLSLVCAVFSPVWIKWREAEKRNREGSPGRAESLAPS